MRHVLLSAGLALSLTIFGCASPSDDVKDTAKWTQVLEDSLSPLDHVAELTEVSYSLQGMFVHDSVWLSGTVWSDSSDAAVNEALIDDVGRAIASSFAENAAQKSWVKVKVVGADGASYQLRDIVGSTTVTLDDLAEHYDIPRR